jgi:hypothetical protein
VALVSVPVSVALVTAVGLDPDLVIAGESEFVVPVASVAVAALTPAPTITVVVPAATAAAATHTPFITPQVTTAQGSITGSGLPPTLVLAASSAGATASGLVPTPALVVSPPVASGLLAGLTPALRAQLASPPAEATLAAATPAARVIVAVLPATSTAAAIAPTLPVSGVVNTTPSLHGLTFGGGTTVMQAAVISFTVVGELVLGSAPATVSFGHTVATTPGEIVLAGTRTRLSKDGDDELRVIARFDAEETGQELVTIENEATGEQWTRPSKLMLIYQMGYGAEWKKARVKRFGRTLPLLRPAGCCDAVRTAVLSPGSRAALSPTRH